MKAYPSKSFFLTLTTIILLISCKQPAVVPDINNTKANEELISLVKKYRGTWVNKAYWDYLLKSGSPFLAAAEAPYFMVYIREDKLEGNLLGLFDYEYGQTEASPIQYFYLKHESLVFSHKTFDQLLMDDTCRKDCRTIKFRVKGKDTLMIYEKEDGSKVEMKRIDISCTDGLFDCDITSLITKHLLVGNYNLLDSQRTRITELVIDEDGKLSGWPAYKKAILWSSFREVNGPYENDVLEFIPIIKQKPDYGWYRGNDEDLFYYQRKQDTIQLRSTSYSEETSEVTAGGVRYYLVRKD